MDTFGRAALLLVCVMIFLSMITIFWVEVSETQDEELNLHIGDSINVTLPEPEEGSLYHQSLRGLDMLYIDILSALELLDEDDISSDRNISNSTTD